ncbi:hypothetical protein QE152_g40608 [Popillia japonica]|uniref:Retrotransposon gag domain-containing protein n=1 Tax=Popillia japonica TaxID=7064 RepID=A0AAW1HFU2_POPJA
MAQSVKKPDEMDFDKNHADAWSFFLQKFQLYLLASKADKESEEHKCALLLHHIGEKGLKIYNTFMFDKMEDKMKYTKVVEKFEEYFIPAKNVTYERHMFLKRDMGDRETVDEYVMALRELAASCEFGSLTDSLIKDKLVQGVKDKAVKDRLLRSKGLDLGRAIDICKAAETTKSQLEKICENTSRIMVDEEVFFTKRGNRRGAFTRNQPTLRRASSSTSEETSQYTTKNRHNASSGYRNMADQDRRWKSETMLEEYEDVFRGIGCMPGQYKIKIKPNAIPVVNAARNVPHSILGKLKNKLNSMCEQNIIKKVTEPTDWVNSLVIVVLPKNLDTEDNFPISPNKLEQFKVESRKDIEIQYLKNYVENDDESTDKNLKEELVNVKDENEDSNLNNEIDDDYFDVPSSSSSSSSHESVEPCCSKDNDDHNDRRVSLNVYTRLGRKIRKPDRLNLV